LTFLVATLGFTPGPVLAPLRQGKYDHVILVSAPGGSREGDEAIQQVHAACKLFGIPQRTVTVADPYDYTAFLKALQDIHAKAKDDYHVNASGGTRIMVMAATIHCFLHDVPLWFFPDETSEGILVPLKAFGSLKDIGDSQSQILRHLQRHGPADMGTLAKAVDLAPSTLTMHIAKLRDAQLVNVQAQGKSRIVSLQPQVQKLRLGAA
jgi:CRISPR locus-related DNA-binding protein